MSSMLKEKRSLKFLKLQLIWHLILFQVDKERNRVSLGMKNSYIEEEETPSRQSHDFAIDMNRPVEPTILPQNNSENMNIDDDDSILGDAESRALVPPLEVPLDDIESFDVEAGVAQGVVNSTTAADTTEDKNKKKAKKKAREER